MSLRLILASVHPNEGEEHIETTSQKLNKHLVQPLEKESKKEKIEMKHLWLKDKGKWKTQNHQGTQTLV